MSETNGGSPTPDASDERAPVPTPAAVPPRVDSAAAIAALAAAAAAAPASDPTAWGRVDDEGNVFVRTPDGGERQVGSWHAGQAEAALGHFGRRYDELATRVRLLRDRTAAGTVKPQQAERSAKELREQLPTATVVGDLAALDRMLDEVDRLVAERRATQAATRTAASERRRGLAEEAERLAESSEWNATGERFRAIVEEWQAAGHGDRATDDQLWQRLAAARSRFAERRKTAFAERDRERERAKERKEELIREAESLRDSTEWRDTAQRYKDLMQQWKAAGRAPREDEDGLWQRFRAAQDAFFARRSETFSARDAEYKGNQTKKEALLARAERIDPTTDLTAAQNTLRDIQDEWDAVGRVPREVMHSLEDRLRAVEERVRDAVDAQWRRTTAASNPLVDQLRRTVGELEERATRAHARGDHQAAAKIERELEGKRTLLSQAEASVNAGR